MSLMAAARAMCVKRLRSDYFVLLFERYESNKICSGQWFEYFGQ